MSLLNLTPAEFCAATKVCADGRKFALTQPSMADVWDNSPRADWLLWITDKIGKRPDARTLRLFAVWCASNTPMSDGRKTGDLLTDPRSLAALGVAERFYEVSATSEDLAAADAAAWAAADAAAWAGAEAAAWDAARAAAWNASQATAWAAQAAHLRTLVPNPFRKEAQP